MQWKRVCILYIGKYSFKNNDDNVGLFWYAYDLILFTDYLLSNNHVNSIIVHKFDFSDEEVNIFL